MGRIRKQKVVIGGTRAVKLGVPSAIGDLYYATMELNWPSFVGLTALVFLLLNIAFGLLYAALPGAIANMVPGSISDGFFFSVETLATVGYGNMAPATRLGHGIAALEILVGLFFSATMTGLIFARFSRPRPSLMFSKVAVIGQFEGKRALMVRVASMRTRPLSGATAQMAWLERRQSQGRIMRRLVNLPLVRANNPTMGLSWTLAHVIEEGSDMLAALEGQEPFTLTVTVTGLDTLLASQSVGGHSYRREDILIDHDYVDVISDVDGIIHLDLGKFHDTVPLPEESAVAMPC
jgi:inward rectifier potassium channel